MFSKSGVAHYEPYWCEMNGHAFNLFIQKGDSKPCVRFDLKEMRLYPAVKGLPGKEINPKSPMLGLVSRYHRMVLENGIQEVPPMSTFFFECSNEEERDRWLLAYYINSEWAQRFSGMFYPRGTARVEYGEGVWRLKIASDNTIRYLKSSRLHVSAKIDGTVYKKGSKFASAWKARYAALKGQCTLEYFTEKGGESLGKLNMSDGKVVLVCNDTLIPPTMASTKEKLSSLKGKVMSGRRGSVAVAPEQPQTASREEKMENLLWFAVLSPQRAWLFRAANLEDLERWMFSMEDRCNDFKQLMSSVKTAIAQAEKSFDNDPCPIRYKMHPLPDSMFPQLERAAIPGRPMSGQFSSEDAVKLSRTTTISSDDAPLASSSRSLSNSKISPRPRGNTAGRNRDEKRDELADLLDEDLDSVNTKPKTAPRVTSPHVVRRDQSGAMPSGSNARKDDPPKTMPSPRGPGGKPALPPRKSEVMERDKDALEDAFDVTGFDDDDAFGGSNTSASSKKPTPAPPAKSPRGGAATPSTSKKPVMDPLEEDFAKERENGLMEKVAALEKQLSASKEEARTAKAQVKKQEREIEQLKADVEEAKGQAKSDGFAEAEVEELKKQLAAEQKNVVKLDAKVKKLTADNEKLQSQAGAAQDAEEVSKELSDLKDQLAQEEEKSSQLETQIDDLKKQLKDAQKSVTELDREKKKKENAEKKVTSLEADVERLEAEVESLKNQVVTLESEVSDSKKSAADAEQLKLLKKEKESAVKKIAALEAKVAQAENEAKNAREAVSSYSKRKSYSGVSDQNVRDVIKSLSDENDALVAQLAALKAASAGRTPGSAEVASLQTELQNALKLLDAAAERLKELEKKGGAVGGAAAPSKPGGASPAELARVKDENAKLQAEKKSLLATIDQLRLEIEQHIQDKEELGKAFEALQEEQIEEEERQQEEEEEEVKKPPPPAAKKQLPVKKEDPKKKPVAPAKKAAVVEEDPFGDSGMPDENEPW